MISSSKQDCRISDEDQLGLGSESLPNIDDHYDNLFSVQEPEPKPVLPDKYQEFSDVFEKRNADQLSKHRSTDCAINLADEFKPFPGNRVYKGAFWAE